MHYVLLTTNEPNLFLKQTVLHMLYNLHYDLSTYQAIHATVASVFLRNRYIMYRRGYKKHTIDQKMFVNLPIFSDGLDCRFFILEPKFDISRQLICMREVSI